MISLHGTGLGATRVSELYRIEQHQIVWMGNNLYYKNISNKRPSADTSSKKSATHKLPLSISRYLLLYDLIGREISKGREQFLFDMSGTTVECTYDNQFFFSEFARIFNHPRTSTSLQMRHLYTQICNYLFPSDERYFHKDKVSTIGQIAEMSCHSEGMHEIFYSSNVNIENFFDKYHQSIGAMDLLNDCHDNVLKLATEADVLCCLRVLLGVSAEFLSDIQRDMVLDACNNSVKHTYCSISCGGGKSMSWIIPAVWNKLNGLQSKLSLVVLPYCFLLDHQVSSTKRVLGQCCGIDVKFLKGQDVDDDLIPDILRNATALPSIIFLSLEGLAKIVDNHLGHLAGLVKQGLLSKIYIDECHTILSEMGFRERYLSMRKLSSLTVPMVFFSGTFQRSFVPDYMSYMFGESQINEIKYLVDKKLFGSQLLRITHHASGNYVNDCCRKVKDFITSNPTSNVHIIVSTKKEGEL